MRIIAIDPGPERSAVVVLEDGKILTGYMANNYQVRAALQTAGDNNDAGELVIEQVSSFGMPVGSEVFETVFWSGRFAEVWQRAGRDFHRLKRHEIKIHLCNSMRAKDSNIRQALIDRYGKPGTKKQPGATYGISGDVWSALAVATTFNDKAKT